MSEDYEYESGHQHTYILAQWLSTEPGIGIMPAGLVSTQIGGGQVGELRRIGGWHEHLS